MATKVTYEDIQEINRVYYECKKYSETARRTGWSAATVKRYVDPHYNPIDETVIRRFTKHDMPPLDTSIFEGIDNFGDLCELSDSERDEIKELWRELTI